jgi:DNA polymerase III epsilon subunit family exonuclease
LSQSVYGFRRALWLGIWLAGGLPVALLALVILVWLGQPLGRALLLALLLLAVQAPLALLTARLLARPLEALIRDLELINRANPAHRAEQPGLGLAALADQVNALAARREQAEGERLERDRLERDAVAHQVLALLANPELSEPGTPSTDLAGSVDDLPLAEQDIVVLDLETTGLDPARDAILSIGAVRIVRGQIARDRFFYALVDPGRPIPPASTRIHGLTDRDVAGRPTVELVLPELVAYCAGAIPAGHLAAFDQAFLNPLLERLALPAFGPALDTLILATVLFPDWPDFNLEAVAQRLGVPVVGRHTALGDALTSAEVLLRQLPLLAGRGLRSWGEVRRSQQRNRLAHLAATVRAELGWG